MIGPLPSNNFLLFGTAPQVVVVPHKLHLSIVGVRPRQSKKDSTSLLDSPLLSKKSQQTIEAACVGNSHCCLPVSTDNFHDDPCHGTIKTLAVTLEGCDALDAPTSYKRHCSLLGQNLLCDEDIEFLAALRLPPALASASDARGTDRLLHEHVALMVDTSWRPQLQHFVVRAASPPRRPAASLPHLLLTSC